MKAKAILVSMIVLLVGQAAIAVGGQTPPNYAKAITDWTPGEGSWPQSPGDPLGSPDYDVVNDAFGIGRGGSITLEMEYPFFDIPGDDLKVYEYGSSAGGTNDSYAVSVSADGQNFLSVGTSPGDATTFDISGLASPGPFRYVKITDTDTTGRYDGADIDAVEAFVPEPASLSLLALCGLAVLRRRRQRQRDC